MESFERQTSSGTNANPLVSPELLLSLATPALLVTLIGGKILTEAVRELGLLSEELFRGERLPVLNFPTTTDANPDDSAKT